MDASRMHLLIVGAGSVGRRHMKNFSTLGCKLSVVEPRSDRLREAQESARLEQTFATLENALEQSRVYSGVVVCSPPKFHVAAAIAALQAGLPVFLEKPVSPSSATAAVLVDKIRRTKVPLLLDYTYRWWPALNELRSRLQAGAVGEVLHVKCVMSAHLSDWHPWERYQDFFMASVELGGGALLDESHFIDLMLWFFGMPLKVVGRVERLSSLEIETDDNVDAILVYPGALRVYVHLDLFGRPHEKFIRVTGDKGSLDWSFSPNHVREAHGSDQVWADLPFQNDRNDMFVAAAREFLEVMEGRTVPSCNIDDGYRVLKVIDAIRESSATGQTVSLERGGTDDAYAIEAQRWHSK